MELLLLRLDHFQDRSKYLSVLREWLTELEIVHGRVITMGTDVQLVLVAASEAQNSQLLALYKSRAIATNQRGDVCVDRFMDVLGRKMLTETSKCKGFFEMNVLSPVLLQKVLVHEWQAEQEWLDVALATTRTKAFLAWKEAAKAARTKRRKREGQEKHQVREDHKRRKEVEHTARNDEVVGGKQDATSGHVHETQPTKRVATSPRRTTQTPHLIQKPQQQQPFNPKKNEEMTIEKKKKQQKQKQQKQNKKTPML